jgi:alpha-D-xyloside xylohydrolase
VNAEDLVRRLQTVIFSPLAMINAWYIKNPPWKQVDREANNAGKFSDNWQEVEGLCRTLIELRMQLLPYLYAAFVRYRLEGLPPVRSLVMDYPDDVKTWTLDDQYLLGGDLLVAPVFAGQNERDVYLPKGEWFDFWTGQRTPGLQTVKITSPLDRIPVFVKAGTLLPLAQPTLHTGDPGSFVLTVRRYGSGDRTATLYEDDGSLKPKFAQVTLRWNEQQETGTVARLGPSYHPSYTVNRWEQIKPGRE